MKKKLKISFYLAFLSIVTIHAQTFDWATSVSGNGALPFSESLSIDDSGNILITGYYSNTADFDPGSGTNEMTSAGFEDIYILKLDASGNFLWARSIGDTGSDKGNDVITDTAGNIYVTGYFTGTVDLDPGTGTHYVSSSGTNDSDIFVLKLDSSGNFLWAKAFGGTGNDSGHSLSIDSAGNIYTTGYFIGTADFDPGAGTQNLTATGSGDFFVQKMDASGNFLWAKSFAGGSNDYKVAVTNDASDNVYIASRYMYTEDFDPGSGTYNLSSNGIWDAFILKLDATGDFQWAKSFGGTGWDTVLSIKTDSSGNVYTTGYFEDTVDFGSGVTQVSSSGGKDIFVKKMDASGNELWTKTFGGPGEDIAFSIFVDDDANVYTTGKFEDTVDFDPGAGTDQHTSAGNSDIFVQKLDTSGDFQWAVSFGGNNTDSGVAVELQGQADIYTTGYFFGTADFEPGAGTYNLTATNYGMFVHKMSQQVTSGIKNYDEKQMRIYPNPNNGIFSIKLNKLYDKIDISIRDLTGKTVYSGMFSNILNINLSINKIPSGVYFVNIQSGTNQKIIKWIKR